VSRTSTSSAPVTYEATVAAGSGTYSAIVQFPNTGSWYMRAVHPEGPLYAQKISEWSSAVSPKSAVTLGTPKTPSKMTHNHTYTVYGSLTPTHPSITYLRYYAYRFKTTSTSSRKLQTVTLKVKVKPSSSGGTAYYASVKLPKAGIWRLRAEHLAHGEGTNESPLEGKVWSSYSSKVTVK